jgi:6-phosphogluconolactonase
MLRSLVFFLALTTMTISLNQARSADDTVRVYVGSYANAKDDGIHLLELDLTNGKLTKVGGTSGVENPSFVAIHPSKHFLYAVCEAGAAGAVAGFAIDPKDGSLTALNSQSSGGAGPCHLTVDKAGKNVLAANYSGGSVCCLPIDADGRLAKASAFIQHHGKSADANRQEAPHAHSVNLDAANHFAFVADLGLDEVLVYKFDADKGSLKANEPPAAKVKPGSGPRHFAFHPNGRFAYVINEMALTVTAFNYDPARGVLTELQTISTVPEGVQGRENSTAEVQVHPSGKFLYGSNRGHDSIAAFAIDATSGRLTPIGHQSSGGKTPRNFGIDPSGRYLLAANQDSDNIVVYKIDGETGKLTPTGNEIKVAKPVCVKFLVR